MLTEADLPEDIDALRALVLEQSWMLAEAQAAKDAQLAELALAKGEADAEIERLQAIINAFMRHRFGARSKQLDTTSSSLDLSTSRRRWAKRARSAMQSHILLAARSRARLTAARSLLILIASTRSRS